MLIPVDSCPCLSKNSRLWSCLSVHLGWIPCIYLKAICRNASHSTNDSKTPWLYQRDNGFSLVVHDIPRLLFRPLQNRFLYTFSKPCLAMLVWFCSLDYRCHCSCNLPCMTMTIFFLSVHLTKDLCIIVVVNAF